MKPKGLDEKLYDKGAITLCNQVCGPLVALEDADALNSLTGYLRVYLAQAAQGLILNDESVQSFLLHAQRAGLLEYTFLDSSYVASAGRQVPDTVPISPDALYLSDAGSQVVAASCPLGINVDRYVLSLKVGTTWTDAAEGVTREGEPSGVDFQCTVYDAGTYSFRVVGYLGSFRAFPGPTAQVVIA